jgi:Xaa-Pro aminopeptidase
MSYELGNIVLWNRKSSPGYYGIIVESELRRTSALPPWRWHKVKFTTPLPPEIEDGWFRCDHVTVIKGYEEISKIHAAMIASANVMDEAR